MRFRQVHLDFHTSGLIDGIGGEFSREQFIGALKTGHVNSITVFSKCHHGWSYHPTKVNETHPGLKFDLLGEQLAACKDAGIRNEVYISAGLDEKAAIKHPEWLHRNTNEGTTWTYSFLSPGYHLMCFNTGYMDLLVAQVKEVMEMYNPEALFLDICSVHTCYCSSCLLGMMEDGLDPSNEADALKYARKVYDVYCNKIRAATDKYNKSAAVFHNAGHIARGRRDLAAYDSHLELESLPTGGWGYDHFPLSASYVRTLGMEYLGMTGKFHKTWGEFGGFKHPNALRYEVALCAALGAGCSIGDQLHPCGEADMTTYNLIGAAYSELEEKEAWCQNAQAIVDIAVLGVEATNRNKIGHISGSDADIGANRILLEGKYLYNFIDNDEDLDRYKLIILPDSIRLDAALKEKLSAYMKNGGKILASGESGLYTDKDEFALPFGIKYKGKNEFKPDYLYTEDLLATNNGVMVMYGQGHIIELAGAKAAAGRQNPYFNRAAFRFSSHQHTPNNRIDAGCAVSYTDKAAYIGWNLFEDYANLGSLQVKELVIAMIEKLIGTKKTLTTSLPDRGIVTLMKQPEANRTINHVLFAHTTTRGKNTEIIEDLLPIYNTTVSIRAEAKPTRVYLAPQNTDLKFTYKDKRVAYTIPSFTCHQMIVIE